MLYILHIYSIIVQFYVFFCFDSAFQNELEEAKSLVLPFPQRIYFAAV